MAHANGSLEFDHIGGLGALLPLGDVETDALVFKQGAKTPVLDGGVVDEQVSAATIGGDEAETLFCVEPFHGAFSHGASSLRGLAPLTWRCRFKVLARPRSQGELNSLC